METKIALPGSKKAISIFGANLISKVFNILFKILLGKYLGAAALGVYGFIFSSSTLLAVVAQVGLHQSSLKFISDYRHNNAQKLYSYISGSIIVVFFLSFIVSIVFYSLTWFGGVTNQSIVPFVVFIIPFTVVFSLRTFLGFVFRSFNLQVHEAFYTTFQYPVTVLVVLAILYHFFGIEDVALILIITISISGAFLIFEFWHVYNRINYVAPRGWRELVLGKAEFNFTMPVWVSTILNVGVKQYDKIFIGLLLPVSQLGLYTAGFTLSFVLNFILSTINPMFQPKIAKHFSNGEISHVRDLYNKYTYLVIVITMPLLFILIVFGKELITFTFGAEFRSAYFCLVVLSIGECINVIAGPGGDIITLGGRPKVNLKLMVLSFVPSIFLCVVLIWYFGINGAAVAVAFGYILNNMLKIFYMKRIFDINFKNDFLAFVLLAISLSGLLIIDLSFYLKLIITVLMLLMHLIYFRKKLGLEKLLD